MPNIAIGLFLFAVSIFSLHGSAAAETSKNIESAIRHAWETNDCKRAASLMDEMRTTSSQAVYSFYQAEAFEFGRCSERNIDKAITAYKNAYNISQSLGAMHIGALYLNEKNDPETAQKWFRVLAFFYVLPPEEQKENIEGQANLIKVLKDIYSNTTFNKRDFPERNISQEIQWATKLLSADPKKIFKYSLIFEKGTNGYPKNRNAAARLLHQAVMFSYPPAAWHQAQHIIKKNHNGNKRSLYLLLKPLEIASLGGIPEAQVELAQTYWKLDKKKKAYSWFLYARKNGISVEDQIKKLEKIIDPSTAQYYRDNIEQKGRKP